MTTRAGILLALLAALTVYGLIDAYSRGHADGLSDASTVALRPRVMVVKMTDTAYRTDTIRLNRWRDRWDSVRVTDTLVRDSIVYVPRDVADSTISACRSVVLSCERRVAARDTLIEALHASLRAERAAKPSRVRVALDRAFWAAAGVGVGVILNAGREP
jgi:hypothetical protein